MQIDHHGPSQIGAHSKSSPAPDLSTLKALEILDDAIDG